MDYYSTVYNKVVNLPSQDMIQRIHNTIIGIAFTATTLGSLILSGLFIGSVFAGSQPGDHALFMPGLACTVMGALSLFITHLARPNQTSM